MKMKKAIYLSVLVAGMMLTTETLIGQSTEKETRTVSGFTEIGFGIAGNLYVKTGAEFSVVLEGGKKYLSEIETVVRNNKLVIRDLNNRFFNNEKANVYITLPNLKGLGVSGSGMAQVDNSLKNDELYLNVSGSGKIIVPDIIADVLNCSISGSGNIALKGNGDIGKGDISISGSGNYAGEAAKFKNLHVQISGSGNCTCNVAESLSASISGSGNINYIGNPKVDARVSGSGHVRSK
jgi:hypothetical protein